MTPPRPTAVAPSPAAAQPEAAKPDASKSDSSKEEPKVQRGGLAAITGGVGAGMLFLRDRVVQTGQVALSLPRVWSDPNLGMSKGKWLSLWGLQLVTAENSNAIVKPSGDLKLFGKTLNNFWGKAFVVNHALQLPLMGVMLASVPFNAKTAYQEDGAAGFYDTRSGRTAVVSAIEGGYLATAFTRAALTAKGQGAGAMMKAAVSHESMGGTKLFVAMLVAENALIANEIGWMDFMGHKDTNEHKPIWKALTGLP